MANSTQTDTHAASVNRKQQLADQFEKVNFPASKTEVCEACGEYELEWTQTEPITLVDAVREIHQDRFESLDELTDAVYASIKMAFGDRLDADEVIINPNLNHS